MISAYLAWNEQKTYEFIRWVSVCGGGAFQTEMYTSDGYGQYLVDCVSVVCIIINSNDDCLLLNYTTSCFDWLLRWLNSISIHFFFFISISFRSIKQKYGAILHKKVIKQWKKKKKNVWSRQKPVPLTVNYVT